MTTGYKTKNKTSNSNLTIRLLEVMTVIIGNNLKEEIIKTIGTKITSRKQNIEIKGIIKNGMARKYLMVKSKDIMLAWVG